MTAAVDTNILLDILKPDSPRFEASYAALIAEDHVIASEVVVAETASRFANSSEVVAFLDSLEVELVRSTVPTLHLAGRSFSEYRKNRPEASCPKCGIAIPGRERVLPDFMIGAHALVHAGRLVTRDRGYYRTYFPELVLV